MKTREQAKKLIRRTILEQLGTPVWVVLSKEWVEDPTGPAAEETKVLGVFRSEQAANKAAGGHENAVVEQSYLA